MAYKTQGVTLYYFLNSRFQLVPTRATKICVFYYNFMTDPPIRQSYIPEQPQRVKQLVQ